MNLKNSDSGTSPLPAGKKRRGLIYLAAILLLMGGIWGAKEAGTRTDARMRRDLARQVIAVASALPANEVQALSFTADDTNRPEFKRIGGHLKTCAEALGLRSLYTMALRDGQIVFGPESLDPSDSYASPPGTVYLEPTEKDREIFSTGNPMVQGPRGDEYGTFVTASAPVIEPRTGKVLMVVGLDIETPAWQKNIRRAQWTSFSIALIPLFFLSLGWLLMELRFRLAPERHRWLSHLEAITCAVIMLLLTIGAGGLIYHVEKNARDDDFYMLAQFQEEVSVQPFTVIRNRLNTLVQFFETNESVSRKEFSTYAKTIIQSPSIYACAWFPEILAEGKPPILSGQSVPAAASYPLRYLESPVETEVITEYNALAEPLLHPAIQETLRTGQSVACDPFKLSMLTEEPTGFFVFKTVTKPQNGLAGFVVLPNDLLAVQSNPSAVDAASISVSLFQLCTGEAPLLLAGALTNCDRACWQTALAGLHAAVPVLAFGKTYCLLITPGPKWLASHPLNYWRGVLFFGFALTLLLTAMISILSHRPVWLETLVKKRTTELRESEAKYRQLAEGTDAILWEYDVVSDRWTYVAPQVERILGYNPEEWTDLAFWMEHIHEQDREQAAAYCAERTGRGEDHVFEYRFMAKNGQAVWVRDSVTVTLKNGKPVKLNGFMTDITEHKLADNLLRVRNEELERFNRAATGRELRMIELKEEINRLNQKLGQDAPYTVVDAEPDIPAVRADWKTRLKKLFRKGRSHEA